jgi:hypothetical protein
MSCVVAVLIGALVYGVAVSVLVRPVAVILAVAATAFSLIGLSTWVRTGTCS